MTLTLAILAVYEGDCPWDRLPVLHDDGEWVRYRDYWVFLALLKESA